MPENKAPAASARSRAETLGTGFWLSLMWIVFIIIVALSAPYLPFPQYDRMDWDHLASPPGERIGPGADDPAGERQALFLGTDTMGRDIAARLAFGARVSLIVGLTAPCIGLVLGGFLGVVAGYYRGRLESAIVAAMDIVLSFPGIVLLLAITFYFGAGLLNMVLALGLLTIPAFARVARANTLTFAQRDFVLAARIIGQSDLSILIREVLPNVILPVMVYALLVVSYLIVAEGALSFLGMGVPPPMPSWGGMIAEGKEVLEEAPHVSLLPALIMYLTVLSFNLIGDALRNNLDSREEKI